MSFYLRIVAGICLLFGYSIFSAAAEETVVIQTEDGWQLVGTLSLPDAEGKLPAVLLCHQFNSNRAVYNQLAADLAERGIASLRLDGRGHGHSTNKGGISQEFMHSSWPDVVAGIEWLKRHPRIDSARLGTISASYSGESVVHAAREGYVAKANVMLSTGRLTNESMESLKTMTGAWWFVASADDPAAMTRMRKAAATKEGAELKMFGTGGHGTGLFRSHPELVKQIAGWFAAKL